jgi:hypothetical protein
MWYAGVDPTGFDVVASLRVKSFGFQGVHNPWTFYQLVHAVCVVDDLIFDARFSHALKLCDDTFKWVCGPKGVCQLGHVLRFCLPHGVKKTKHERVMRHNWR